MAQISIAKSFDPNLIQGRIGEFMGMALGEGLKVWRDDLLPQHFTYEAYSRYGYRQRTAAYTRFKMRKFAHANPLMLTGKSRNMAIYQSKIEQFAQNAELTIPLPSYWFHEKTRWYADELTRIPPDEVEYLTGRITDFLTTKLQQLVERKQ